MIGRRAHSARTESPLPRSVSLARRPPMFAQLLLISAIQPLHSQYAAAFIRRGFVYFIGVVVDLYSLI